MTWDYLQSKKWDMRLEIIADYLKGKTEGKHIVDLNSGTARLVNFIDHDFASYYGNDILKAYIDEANGYGIPNTKFEVKDDKDIRLDKVDILLFIGNGAGEYVTNDFESKTQNQTAQDLVLKHKPEIVIFEGIKDYMDKYLEAPIRLYMEKFYDVEYKITLSIDDKHWVNERVILIYKRK